MNTYSEVVIIEGDTSIKMTRSNSLFSPTRDMHYIEQWEDLLAKRKVPYLLVQCVTTEDDPIRFSRGYVIFVKEAQKTIDKLWSRYMNDHLGSKL